MGGGSGNDDTMITGGEGGGSLQKNDDILYVWPLIQFSFGFLSNDLSFFIILKFVIWENPAKLMWKKH